MASLKSDLDILQGPIVARTAPAIGQVVTPLSNTRAVYVSASVTASVRVSLTLVRAVIEVSDDGTMWMEVDAAYSSAGVLNLARALDGYAKLGAFVRPGQMYRVSGTGQGVGGSFAVQDLHETAIEISSHRSVAFEYLSGAMPVPDNSHMHECGAPCFAPNLFIDQYKRDPSEVYRPFDTAGDPPKGYVRAEAGGGDGGPAPNPLTDDSGNGHHLTAPSGMPPPMAAPYSGFSSARHMSHAKYLEAPFNLNGYGDFTLEGHISGVDASDVGDIKVLMAAWHQTDTTRQQFAVFIPASGLQSLRLFTLDSTGTAINFNGTIDIMDGQDHHWRVVRSGTTLTILIDGAVDVTGTLNSLQTVVNNIRLGGYEALPSSHSIGVDEVRISDIARDDGGAYTPSASPFTSDANTVAVWHLDGPIAGDELQSTGALDLTSTGSPIDVPAALAGMRGRRFDESNYYTSDPLPAYNSTDSYGVGFWFRVAADPTTGRLNVITNHTSTATYLWTVLFDTSMLSFTKLGTAATRSVTAPISLFSDREWHYVECVATTTVIAVYVDGIAVDSGSTPLNQSTAVSGGMKLGGLYVPADGPCDGVIELADVTIRDDGVVRGVPTNPDVAQITERGQTWPFHTAEATTGSVPGDDLLVAGRKADDGSPGSFKLNWRGVDYTESNSEIFFPTSTTWEFKGDPGDDAPGPGPGPNGGHILTVTQDGQPTQQVEICIDRTAPSATLAFDGAVQFGDGAGLNALYRGEYLKLLPTYDDTGAGIEDASLSYEHPAYWTGEPTQATDSGVPTGWFRSSASAPDEDADTDITLTVEDKAGNMAQDVLTVHFTSLPAVPAVALSDLTGAERPAHLNAVEYAETPYDDNTVGATMNITPPVEECRNSAIDDTRSQLASGGLSVNTSTNNDVDSVAAVVHSTNVQSQPSRLGVGIKGRVRDQYYRETDSAEAGDYAFNARRGQDFSLDQTIGIGSPPFTGKAVEPFTDEFAADSLTNCRIFDGAIEWQANGAVLEVTLALTSNSGQLYQPRLFDKAGAELLYATYGNEVDVKLHDGTGFVGPAGGDSFGPNASFDLPALNSAASVLARITVTDISVPLLGAFIMNYKA